MPIEPNSLHSIVNCINFSKKADGPTDRRAEQRTDCPSALRPISACRPIGPSAYRPFSLSTPRPVVPSASPPDELLARRKGGTVGTDRPTDGRLISHLSYPNYIFFTQLLRAYAKKTPERNVLYGRSPQGPAADVHVGIRTPAEARVQRAGWQTDGSLGRRVIRSFI